jgi:hypothetical protein
MAFHVNLFSPNKEYFTNNLGPYNEPRNAQISHYWPKKFVGPDT